MNNGPRKYLPDDIRKRRINRQEQNLRFFFQKNFGVTNDIFNQNRPQSRRQYNLNRNRPQINNRRQRPKRINFNPIVRNNSNNNNMRVQTRRNLRNDGRNQDPQSRIRFRRNRNINNNQQLRRQEGRVNRASNRPNSDNKKLIVTEIDSAKNDSDLRTLFSPYGIIKKCNIIYNENNESTGEAVVIFKVAQDAKRARGDLNSKFLF